MKNRPQISVVLGSYNRLWALKLAIQSVRDNGITVPYEIIVVDGGSTDGALRWLIRQRDIITIVQHNREKVNGRLIGKRSWGYFMNLAFKITQGKYILMISDDTILHPGAVMAGYQALEAGGPEVAACAFYFRDYPQDERYRVGYVINHRLSVNHGMFRRDVAEEVNWLDEERYQFYYADSDFALKMWEKGYRIVDCPGALVEHYRSKQDTVRDANAQMAADSQDLAQYLQRWGQGVAEQEELGGAIYLPDHPPDPRVAAAFDRHRPKGWAEYLKPLTARLKLFLPAGLVRALWRLKRRKHR
jgi:GT2 family glycosyltransferase